MSSYDKNIFWSEIPKDAKVYDLGSSYVVHMPDGTKGVVYWTGSDAGKAQDFLKMKALPKSALEKEKISENMTEEEYEKLMRTAKGHDRVALMRKAADQLSNNPAFAHPLSGTSRRIAGLRSAATRLEKKLKG